ncbi:hypothetical protein HPB48_019299 [Haemaphysalis longicornis]|uniref:Uncharacterized protein n=1 Tax=Haemaphysalis longicornis TaxID=44386 RepID=A0A9J6FC28_HAELO|nr:hypothetical protein HPB48_019299 [Haemaphysalis longicornis]
MEVVSQEINNYGSVRCHNDCGVSSAGFLELLGSYHQSSIVEFEGAYYQQKQGVRIGFCLAPAQCDMLMARFDRWLEHELGDVGIVRVFWFVDDYIVPFMSLSGTSEQDAARWVLQFLNGHLTASP